jgi:hypothetical protein
MTFRTAARHIGAVRNGVQTCPRRGAPNSTLPVVYGKNLQPWVNTTLSSGELHLLRLPYIV